MSRGPGIIQNLILITHPSAAKAADFTLDGHTQRMNVATVDMLCKAIYGASYSHWQEISTRRALKSLAAAGRIHLFYAKVAGARGPRTQLFIAVNV